MYTVPMKNKGFTLIELLVVVAIIGILATVVLASLGRARSNARIAKAQAEINQMKTLMVGAQLNSDQTLADITGFHGSGDPCVTDIQSSGCITRWENAIDLLVVEYDSSTDISGFYRDPWGNPYVLNENEGASGFSDCSPNTLLSAGLNGVVDGGTGDDIIGVIPGNRC